MIDKSIESINMTNERIKGEWYKNNNIYIKKN